MAIKTAAAVAPPPPPIKQEEAANLVREMDKILSDLDKQGELTRFLKNYSEQLEKHTGLRKIGGAGAAKKK